MPGGDGDMLGLVDEQTGQVLRLLYDGEVGAGALTLAGASGRELVWTRGKANGGDFLGLAIDAAGEIATLRIDARPSAAAGRAFALFLTERSALYRGFCDKAP